MAARYTRSRDYYDRESKVYLIRRPFMEKYAISRIIRFINQVMTTEKRFDGSFLVVGTGPGWLERAFPAVRFVSVDISPEMTRLAGKNVSPIVAAGEYLPIREKSFSTIIVSRAIKFMDIPHFLDEVKRVMNEDGMFLLVYDCGDAFWVRLLERMGYLIDPGSHDHTLRSGELQQELKRAGLVVRRRRVITVLPPRIFAELPGLLIRVLGTLETRMHDGRISLVVASSSPDKSH